MYFFVGQWLALKFFWRHNLIYVVYIRGSDLLLLLCLLSQMRVRAYRADHGYYDARFFGEVGDSRGTQPLSQPWRFGSYQHHLGWSRDPHGFEVEP